MIKDLTRYHSKISQNVTASKSMEDLENLQSPNTDP